MEPLKKKGKKGFAVPVAKLNSEPDDNNLELSKNKNDESCKEKIKKPKTERKEKKTTRKDYKMEKEAGNIQANPANKQNRNKKAAVGKPKAQARSLTDQEYDDLFMAVLQSVMKSESQDDDAEDLMEEDSAQVGGTHQSVDTTTAMTDNSSVHLVEEDDAEDDDQDDPPCEVIKVTVMVEDIEDQDPLFDQVLEGDIDKWESTEDVKKRVEIHQSDNTCSEVVQSSMHREKNTKHVSKEKQSGRRATPIDVNKKFSVPDQPAQARKEKKKCEKKSKGGNTSHPQTKETPSPVKVSTKQRMAERELEDLGTWVQCGNTNCLKWRYLTDVSDPMEIPDHWNCSMNSNEARNNCSKPEEDYDEEEHIYTKYTEGSVVLARMAGYPWWPAMVEIDPDYNTFFEVVVPTSMYPTKYHVVFFDNNVSRAWVSVSAVKPFQDHDILPRKTKGHNYTREVNMAIKNAQTALELSIKERLKKFSFAARFSGKWGHSGVKKSQKQNKSNSGGPKRRRLKRKSNCEEVEEQLLDDATLNEILSSQSMFSDVDEILGSMESELLDKDDDSSFHLHTPRRPGKTIKREDSENHEDSSLHLHTPRRPGTNIKLEDSENHEGKCSAENSTTIAVGQQMTEKPGQFQFNSDIFTMDMSSQDSYPKNVLTQEKNDDSETENKLEQEGVGLESKYTSTHFQTEGCNNDEKTERSPQALKKGLDVASKDTDLSVKQGIRPEDEIPSKHVVPSNMSKSGSQESDVEKPKKKKVNGNVAQGDLKHGTKKRKSECPEKATGKRKEVEAKKTKKKEVVEKGKVKSGMTINATDTKEENNFHLPMGEGSKNQTKAGGNNETKPQTGEKKRQTKAGKNSGIAILQSSGHKFTANEQKKGTCGKPESGILIENEQCDAMGSESDLQKDQLKYTSEDDMQQKRHVKSISNMANPSRSSQKGNGTRKDENKKTESLHLDHERKSSQRSTKSETGKRKFEVKQKQLCGDELHLTVNSVTKLVKNEDDDSDDFMLDFDIPVEGKTATVQQKISVTSTANEEDSEPLDFEE